MCFGVTVSSKISRQFSAWLDSVGLSSKCWLCTSSVPESTLFALSSISRLPPYLRPTVLAFESLQVALLCPSYLQSPHLFFLAWHVPVLELPLVLEKIGFFTLGPGNGPLLAFLMDCPLSANQELLSAWHIDSNFSFVLRYNISSREAYQAISLHIWDISPNQDASFLLCIWFLDSVSLPPTMPFACFVHRLNIMFSGSLVISNDFIAENICRHG